MKKLIAQEKNIFCAAGGLKLFLCRSNVTFSLHTKTNVISFNRANFFRKLKDYFLQLKATCKQLNICHCGLVLVKLCSDIKIKDQKKSGGGNNGVVGVIKWKKWWG